MEPVAEPILTPNAPPMRPVETWRVIGYTHQQLAETRPAGEVAGWSRVGEARTLEMVAHLIASECDLVILQKVEEA